MAGQMLPPSSPHAKDFLDAYKDYLDAEQAILDGPMQQIVAKVDDNSVEPAVKWDTIKSLMAQVKAQEDDRDNGAFPRLMTAQTTYAHDHNYQTVWIGRLRHQPEERQVVRPGQVRLVRVGFSTTR